MTAIELKTALPSLTDEQVNFISSNFFVGRSLVALINADEDYRVTYTIDQSGNKHYEYTTLKGKDLTEKQIIEVVKNGKG